MPRMSDSPVSVVTGANSGIGRATALHLAGVGHAAASELADPDPHHILFLSFRPWRSRVLARAIGTLPPDGDSGRAL